MLRFLSAIFLAACLLVLSGGCHPVPPPVRWHEHAMSDPVVVIESDDWGFRGWNRDLFADVDDAAHAEVVRQVAAVLARHHDSAGRPAVLSAFVVVGNPDVPAILADPSGQYHWRPIDQTSPKLVAALKQAEKNRLFALHYHGRDHIDGGVFCQRLREAAGHAATVPDGGRSLLESVFRKGNIPDRDRLMAEYFDSRTDYLGRLDEAELEAKVASGLREYRRIFGRNPISTVAPRYLWDAAAERCWKAHGIRFVHGIDRQVDGPDGRTRRVASRGAGYRTACGLLGIARNVGFDDEPDVDDAMDAARRAVRSGRPVVICTHAWNYYNLERDRVARPASSDMLERLDELLTALETRFPSLRYMTSEELGRIISAESR